MLIELKLFFFFFSFVDITFCLGTQNICIENKMSLKYFLIPVDIILLTKVKCLN